MTDTHKCILRSRRTFLTLTGGGMSALLSFRPQSPAQAAGLPPISQPANPGPGAFIARAFEMRDRAAAEGDQPYGAIIVTALGQIVGEAPSRVITNQDPTAHAEMEAIRNAALRLGTRDLSGHTIYSSTHPCPMCEAAAYWAGVGKMIHGRSADDGGTPRLCG